MDVNIHKLLEEVEADLKNLLKSEQDSAALKKAEESSKEESSKEESSKEESKMEKADEESSEGSGFESPVPEASEPAQDQADPAAEMQPEEPQEQGEEADAMLKELDDDMLHELYQKIKMELMARMQEHQPQDQDAQPAAEPQPEPAQDAQPLAMSEKVYSEKLTKAESDLKAKEDEISKLKKSLEEHEKGLNEFADIVKTLVDRPVVRAVTDIQFVSKEGALKKSENMSTEEIKKAVDALSGDRRQLASLTKAEREVILDFYSGKNVTDKILKVINK